MSQKFSALIDEALAVEKELRRLTPDKPSLRCFISICLERAGADYSAVEEIKERPAFALKSGTAAFVRDLAKQILNGRVTEPVAKQRVGSLFFAQKDEAIMELGGQPERLFLLWAIAAEVAYQQNAAAFGAVEDLPAHRARISELEAKRKQLYSAFPAAWRHDDLHIGRITSDGAALITFAKAPGEVPVHPPASAGERLVDHLLEHEVGGRRAKAA